MNMIKTRNLARCEARAGRQISKIRGGFTPTPNSKQVFCLRPLAVRCGGFTMVELLVAISLFSLVVVVAVGGLANTIRTQRQLAAMIAANSNISLALEQMARDIRTGSGFCATVNITDSCPGWPNEIDFTNAAGQDVAYRLNAGKIEKDDGSGVFRAITGDNTVVRYLNFTLMSRLSTDSYPARIMIDVGVSPPSSIVGVSDIISRIQTTVSSRQSKS